MSGTHRIIIRNIEGEFLKDKDLIGKQDPFVVFEYGDQKTQTKALKSAGTHAIWSDEYTLSNLSSGVTSGQLRVAVYNHNTLLPDGLIGHGATVLSEGRNTVSLVDKKGADAGVLRFHVAGHGLFGSGTTGGHRQSAYGTSGGAAGAGATGLAAGAGTGALAGRGVTSERTTEREYGTTAGHGGARNINTGDYVSEEERRLLAGRGGVEKTRRGVDGLGINDRNVNEREGGGVREKAREVKEDVKDVFRGHGHGHKTETATAGRGTGVGTGYASLNNYNFAEGALQLRGEHYEVCDSKTFVVVEDRPIEKEIVHRYIEHIPVEKKYIVETKFAGEVEKSSGRRYESGGTRERIVSVAQPGTVCEGAPKIEVEQSSGYREVHESARSTTTTGTATSATTGTATTGTTGIRSVTQDYPTTGATLRDAATTTDSGGVASGLHTGATPGVTAGHRHVTDTTTAEEGRGSGAGILQGLKDSVHKVTGGRV